MKRLAIALLVVAACSGSHKKANTAGNGSGSDGPAILSKKVSLEWGITPNGAKADVFLQATDEVGKMVSYPIGSYDGTCDRFTPGAEMKALSGVRCTSNGTTTELHAVLQRGGQVDHVIIVAGKVAAGGTLDPMAREQVTQIEIPLGAAVEAAK
jgi:hypothetical protein